MSRKEFDGERYLQFLEGKKTKNYKKSSYLGNRYLVRIIDDESSIPNRRLISGLLIRYTKSKKSFLGYVSLPTYRMVHLLVSRINGIVEHWKNEFKELIEEDIQINEIILIPQEHHVKFLKVQDEIERYLPHPTYSFYFSEFNLDDNEIAFLIEFSRNLNHFIELDKLMDLIDMGFIEDEVERDTMQVYYDSTSIYLISLIASHLRESLKLLGEFTKTDIYQKILPELEEIHQNNLSTLQHNIDDFNDKKGFLYETLRVFRNKIFHYVPKDVKKWVQECKIEEKGRKPRFRILSFNPIEMGIGIDFEQQIYFSELFIRFENGGVNYILPRFIEMRKKFMEVSLEIIQLIMKQTSIPEYRSHNWHFKHIHGYKEDIQQK